MATDGCGLYVHIPFCKRKCAYCDFCSYEGLKNEVIGEYIAALLAEAKQYSRDKRIQIDTLYFGGGTPSLLAPHELSRILDGLSLVFDLSHLAELTLEANPGTLDREKLVSYRSLGVNRLSIGLQSIHDNELKILGRIHNYAEFLDSYRLARSSGFDNVSVDVMYGIPEQTCESFCSTLDALTDLSPEHISAYGLIVEEGTPFYGLRDSLPLPGEDAELEMYYSACEKLAAAGYTHYEISNYAKPGRESQHNLKYWRDREYIGLGAAAYSYFGGERYGNVRSLDGYLSGASRENTERVSFEDEMFEYAMMHLRLAEGISLLDYEARFGRSFLADRMPQLRRFSDMGLLSVTNERVTLTERGFYLSNTIMSEIL